MFYVRNFIVGGYAYYRKKGFGHSGSVSMVLLSSLGFMPMHLSQFWPILIV